MFRALGDTGKRNNSSKKPKFFCESCGAEVPIDEKKCPKCGSDFASIRCPACGFIGDDDMFEGGCPICGYSSGKNSSEYYLGDIEDVKKAKGSLPLWAYILTVLVFLGIVIALILTVSK